MDDGRAEHVACEATLTAVSSACRAASCAASSSAVAAVDATSGGLDTKSTYVVYLMAGVKCGLRYSNTSPLRGDWIA